MKAVIPAAGLGTRFLPLTKEQPKEMLPVVDRPAIHCVVEEATYPFQSPTRRPWASDVVRMPTVRPNVSCVTRPTTERTRDR